MSAPPRRPWRVMYVFWALVLGLLAALALAFLYHTPDSHLQVQWDWRNWRFGAYEKRNVIQPPFPLTSPFVTPPRNHTLVMKGYHLGPLNVFKVWGENGPDPLGTNTLSVGDRLFDPVTKRELWRVLATERDHEFEDGSERDAVRVRDLVNGGEAWVPRTNLSKALLLRSSR